MTRALGGFAAFGLFWGAWGAALPAVQVRSGSTDGELGAALLMIGLGALLHAGAGWSSTAPAVFASAAAAGRFAGNALVRSFDPVRLLIAGALTATAGTLAAAAAGAASPEWDSRRR
ncbi:MAG: hypothetical protein WA731_00815 [Pseudonocardiaceae bacterium]